VYAIYQLVPKNDNRLLKQTRIPALAGFLGSTFWLFFAQQENWLLWLTIPTLILMAFFFTKVIRATADISGSQKFFSQIVLYPYAAWTGIAFWLNVQAVAIEKGLINSSLENQLVSGLLFIGIVLFTGYYFRKTQYSLWYGGVLVWASIGIVVANINEYESQLFAAAAGLFGAIIAVITCKRLITINLFSRSV
jgi:hypothetical protein